MIAYDIPPPPPSDNVLLSDPNQLQEVRGISDIIPEYTKEFVFPFSTFCLEKGVSIKFKAPLVLKKIGRNAYLEAWDFYISGDKLSQIEQKIPRHFLTFLSKAKNGQLSEAEEELWIKIIDSIDYESLSTDLTRPFYIEGEIKQIHASKGLLICWQDDSTEWLSNNLKSTFRLLEKGDKFSAYIKRNSSQKIINIENICLRNEDPIEINYNEIPVLKS